MKLKILAEVDKSSISKSDIAKIYNNWKSTLFTIVKNQNSVLKSEKSGVKIYVFRAEIG